MMSTRSLLYVFVGAALTTGLVSCLFAVRPSMAYGASAASQVNAEVPSLLAQTWPPHQHEQYPAERPIRLRAKSVIKLGLFVAALIGGLITFLIRLVSGKSKPPSVTAPTGSAPETGVSPPSSSLPPVRNGSTVAAPTVTGNSMPPGRLAAKPKQRETAPSDTGNGRVVAVIAIGISALVFVSLCCAGLVFLAYQMFTPSSAGSGTLSSETLNLGPVTPVEPEASEIDQRWQESVRADQLINEDPRPSFQELAAPESPIPAISWDASDLVDSGISLTHRGMSFDDTAPAGGVLVGFRVTGSRHQLQSIQPIYQLEASYVLGKVHGQESDEQVAHFLAESGDAVSAMRLDLGFRVEGVQVEFGRIADGRVDSTETYTSPFFGRKIAHSSVVVEGEGDAFVGISGTIRDGFDGLSLKRNMALGPCEDVRAEIDTTSWTTLPRAGGNAGNQFRDRAPDGGFLVGMRVFIGRSWGRPVCVEHPLLVFRADPTGRKLGEPLVQRQRTFWNPIPKPELDRQIA